MPDISSQTALASALAVAAVAGSFSIFNLLANKDQKISEYRQEWLEEVRKDVATIVSQTHLLFGLILMHQHQIEPQKIEIRNIDTYIDRTTPIYDELNRAHTRLKLRLNKKKPLHQAVLGKMQDLEIFLGDANTFLTRLVQEGGSPLKTEIDSITSGLEDCSSELIGNVWQKVKSGEPIYIWGRWVLAFLVCLVFAVLYMIK